MYTHRHQQTPGAAPAHGPAPRGNSWQTRATAAYHRGQPDEAELRLKLAAAVQTLTGRAVEADAIVVEPAGRTASVHVDGVHFRWAGGRLVVVRPCAHCGLGAFTSLPVHRAELLGFALSGWQPLHDDCRPFEADAID